MKKLVFLLLALSFESFAYQEIEVKFNDANKTDRYFALDVKKIGSNNDVLYKHINNFSGIATTYVRVEINCQNKIQRLLGSSGISPEKIDFQAEAEVKKHVPEAYELMVLVLKTK